MAFEEDGQAAAQDQRSSEKRVELGHEKDCLNNEVTAPGGEAGEPIVTAKTWIVCVVCGKSTRCNLKARRRSSPWHTDPLPRLWPLILGRARHVSHRRLDCR